MRYAGIRSVAASAVLLVVATMLGCAGAAAPAKGNAVQIDGADFSFAIKQPLKPGLNAITFKNTGKETHQVAMISLGEGKTVQDLAAAFGGPTIKIPPWMRFWGGVGASAPGTISTVTTKLDPGKYILLCFLSGDDGVPHAAKGMVAQVEIAGDAVAGDVPSNGKNVVAKDYAFSLPTGLKAGEVTLHFENSGKEAHEMAVMPMPPGTNLDAMKKMLAQPPTRGTPPPPLTTGFAPVSPGGTQTLQASLQKGSYVVLCFVRDANGTPHFALGMVDELKVE